MLLKPLQLICVAVWAASLVAGTLQARLDQNPISVTSGNSTSHGPTGSMIRATPRSKTLSNQSLPHASRFASHAPSHRSTLMSRPRLSSGSQSDKDPSTKQGTRSSTPTTTKKQPGRPDNHSATSKSHHRQDTTIPQFHDTKLDTTTPGDRTTRTTFAPDQRSHSITSAPAVTNSGTALPAPVVRWKSAVSSATSAVQEFKNNPNKENGNAALTALGSIGSAPSTKGFGESISKIKSGLNSAHTSIDRAVKDSTPAAFKNAANDAGSALKGIGDFLGGLGGRGGGGGGGGGDGGGENGNDKNDDDHNTDDNQSNTDEKTTATEDKTTRTDEKTTSTHEKTTTTDKKTTTTSTSHSKSLSTSSTKIKTCKPRRLTSRPRSSSSRTMDHAIPMSTPMATTTSGSTPLCVPHQRPNNMPGDGWCDCRGSKQRFPMLTGRDVCGYTALPTKPLTSTAAPITTTMANGDVVRCADSDYFNYAVNKNPECAGATTVISSITSIGAAYSSSISDSSWSAAAAKPSAECSIIWDDGIGDSSFEVTGINDWAGENGNKLNPQEHGCGWLTNWKWHTGEKQKFEGRERTTQWVTFELSLFKSGCVERAIQSAGGPDITCHKNTSKRDWKKPEFFDDHPSP